MKIKNFLGIFLDELFFSGLGRFILTLLFGGCLMIYMSAADAAVSLKPAISFQDMIDGREVKAGSHVAGDVIYAMDYFASESTYTQYKDGSRSGDRKSGNYYLIPIENGYIGLKSRQADVPDLNRLSEETLEFLTSGTVPTTKIFMQGRVKIMEDDVAEYYRDYLEDMGLSKDEIAAMGEPLVIQYVNFTSMWVMFAIGVVLVVLTLFLLWHRCQHIMRGSGLRSVEDIPDTDTVNPQL